jgi:hypothetical protein
MVSEPKEKEASTAQVVLPFLLSFLSSTDLSQLWLVDDATGAQNP